MTIHFAPEAEEDFAAVIGYLAERNPTAAAYFGRRIFAAIDKLAANEFDGTERALTTGEIVQGWAVPPVRIYYDASTIRRVLRSHRERRRCHAEPHGKRFTPRA